MVYRAICPIWIMNKQTHMQFVLFSKWQFDLLFYRCKQITLPHSYIYTYNKFKIMNLLLIIINDFCGRFDRNLNNSCTVWPITGQTANNSVELLLFTAQMKRQCSLARFYFFFSEKNIDLNRFPAWRTNANHLYDFF